MDILESLLRSFDTNVVSGAVLILMLFVFGSGLFYTKKARQVEFVQFVPTLLTTMGIFGTFLGIVLGLLEFNQNDIEASIPLLLAGLKTAFITSLAGIFLSLVFKTLSTFSFLKPKQLEDSISQYKFGDSYNLSNFLYEALINCANHRQLRKGVTY